MMMETDSPEAVPPAQKEAEPVRKESPVEAAKVRMRTERLVRELEGDQDLQEFLRRAQEVRALREELDRVSMGPTSVSEGGIAGKLDLAVESLRKCAAGLDLSRERALDERENWIRAREADIKRRILETVEMTNNISEKKEKHLALMKDISLAEASLKEKQNALATLNAKFSARTLSCQTLLDSTITDYGHKIASLRLELRSLQTEYTLEAAVGKERRNVLEDSLRALAERENDIEAQLREKSCDLVGVTVQLEQKREELERTEETLKIVKADIKTERETYEEFKKRVEKERPSLEIAERKMKELEEIRGKMLEMKRLLPVLKVWKKKLLGSGAVRSAMREMLSNPAERAKWVNPDMEKKMKDIKEENAKILAENERLKKEHTTLEKNIQEAKKDRDSVTYEIGTNDKSRDELANSIAILKEQQQQRRAELDEQRISLNLLKVKETIHSKKVADLKENAEKYDQKSNDLKSLDKCIQERNEMVSKIGAVLQEREQILKEAADCVKHAHEACSACAQDARSQFNTLQLKMRAAKACWEKAKADEEKDKNSKAAKGEVSISLGENPGWSRNKFDFNIGPVSTVNIFRALWSSGIREVNLNNLHVNFQAEDKNLDLLAGATKQLLETPSLEKVFAKKCSFLPMLCNVLFKFYCYGPALKNIKRLELYPSSSSDLRCIPYKDSYVKDDELTRAKLEILHKRMTNLLPLADLRFLYGPFKGFVGGPPYKRSSR